MINDNIILLTDSYKPSHWRQYPDGTTGMYSYFESRGGALSDEIVFFGLSYILQRYLAGVVITEGKILEAQSYLKATYGRDDVFNEDGWLHIIDRHKGKLPLSIRAVHEGEVVSPHNALFTVENTCPECYWLTSYVETLLCQVWYPSTVATLSREVKKLLYGFANVDGTNKASIDFKLHDFGARGSSSMETAAIGGAAHLVNFQGTDTVPALALLREYYGSQMAGFAIPASEHSTITAFGRDGEAMAFRKMLNTYPIGSIAVVSDSYDIFNAIDNYWGFEFKDEVLARDGVLVIRPDSGDPVETCLKVMQRLEAAFGTKMNERGYRVLPPQVRMIQGDGVDIDSIEEILNAFHDKKYALENIAFGMGGGLLQKVHRDTLNFTYKASMTKRGSNLEWPISKSPIGSTMKASKEGRLTLQWTGKKHEFNTVQLDKSNTDRINDQLKPVFLNGEVLYAPKLEDIRHYARVE